MVWAPLPLSPKSISGCQLTLLKAGNLSLLIDLESKVELHSGLEREVAQLLERVPDNLETDLDPEQYYDEHYSLQRPTSLAPLPPQEIQFQSGTQANIRSNKGHHYVSKQSSSEGRGTENARTGINTYLQSGHEARTR